MSQRHRLAAAALVLCAATALAGCSSDSSSSDASTTADEGQTFSTVEDCTNAGQVWLVVSTDTDDVLANECIGTPDTGTAALEAAGLSIGRDDAGQFICTIGDYPSTCPTTYDMYWNYYHATPGGSWEYSQEGADSYVPQAGSIEGWCYGSSCTPVGITGSDAPSAAASDGDESTSEASSSDASADDSSADDSSADASSSAA